MNQLDQLKQYTVVVADTGDFGSLKQYAPRDATTNPSLILKAAQMPEYKYILDKTLADSQKVSSGGDARLRYIMDDLLVSFGLEILKIVPGRVSTETDANMSFDTEALVAKGKKFIDLYQKPDAVLDLPYLYRAVTNRCLTFLRDERNRARLLDANDVSPPPRTLSDERAIGRDLVLKLWRELDDAHCEVLAYRFLDDMTQDEIAELLGLSRKTIGKRLDRIREAVRRLSGPRAAEEVPS